MTTRSRSRVVAAVLALGVPLLTGGGLAVWALADSPLESAAEIEPLVATVESAERLDLVSTSATFVPAHPVSVLSQSSGTVTSLSIVPGQALVAGEPALVVDGRPVVAYVSPSPLYRDITEGLTGDDVATAQQLLVDMGYLHGVDGRAGRSTTSAIRAFNTAEGYGDQNSVLAVGSLLWVPEGSAPPQVVGIDVGQVVAPQAELYTTASGDDRIEVRAAADTVDRVLTVGPVTAVLVAGHTAVTAPTDVAALRGALGDETTASATLQSVTPRPVGTVPTTAVVAGTDGIACFFTDEDGPGVRIDAVDGSFGLVDVDPGLVGTRVLINPRATREDLACGS